MNWFKTLYKAHGTKLLGCLQIVANAAVATHGLLTGRALVWAMFINMVVGGFTLKRGFDNDKV